MKQMIESIMQDMISYYAKDPRRIFHFLKVFTLAKQIAEMENIDAQTAQMIQIAALTHDIGIKTSEIKYRSSSGHHQQIEGPPIARELLSKYDLTEEQLDRICFLISRHHTYNEIDGIDLQILIEADFLVNLYEDDCSQEQIEKVLEKIFKTATGKKICRIIFFGE